MSTRHSSYCGMVLVAEEGLEPRHARIMMPGLSPTDQRLDNTTTVKPASEDQKLSRVLSNRSLTRRGQLAADTSTLDQPKSRRGVRKPTLRDGALPVPSPLPGAVAHPSNRLIAQLNKNWRVVDDPLQWILQRRKGNPRKKNSGWQDRSFCRTRGGLLRCVRENCDEVDQDAVTRLQKLPEFHPDWEQAR